MCHYLIKKAIDLSTTEIKTILFSWNIDEWKTLTDFEFQSLFQHSEFHFMANNKSAILSLARINFDFKLSIAKQRYTIPELVGFASVTKGKGHGSVLLKNIITNLKSRNVEALGFCKKELRPFYEKCSIPILYSKARFIKEQVNDEWQSSTDDDILNLTLSNNTAKLLESLNNDQPAYFIN